jgi:hypothetical protein
MLSKKTINNPNNNLLNILKDYKQKHGLTVRKLAEEFGVSREVMNGYLNGYFAIPAPALFAGILSKHPELISEMHSHILTKHTEG